MYAEGFSFCRACLPCQAVYCEANDDILGNGAITRALMELEKYHDALDGDFYRESLYNEDAERPKQHHTVNHRVGRPLLMRRHAASSVHRAEWCSTTRHGYCLLEGMHHNAVHVSPEPSGIHGCSCTGSTLRRFH